MLLRPERFVLEGFASGEWPSSAAPSLMPMLTSLARVTVVCCAVFGVAQPLGIGIWLILPVVICLSQRLSHACLSISNLYSETANGSLNQL